MAVTTVTKPPNLVGGDPEGMSSRHGATARAGGGGGGGARAARRTAPAEPRARVRAQEPPARRGFYTRDARRASLRRSPTVRERPGREPRLCGQGTGSRRATGPPPIGAVALVGRIHNTVAVTSPAGWTSGPSFSDASFVVAEVGIVVGDDGGEAVELLRERDARC